MNITFIQEPVPELTITSGQLAALGFSPIPRPGQPVRVIAERGQLIIRLAEE
jgi:hypothetical protein